MRRACSCPMSVIFRLREPRSLFIYAESAMLHGGLVLYKAAAGMSVESSCSMHPWMVMLLGLVSMGTHYGCRR